MSGDREGWGRGRGAGWWGWWGMGGGVEGSRDPLISARQDKEKKKKKPGSVRTKWLSFLLLIKSPLKTEDSVC